MNLNLVYQFQSSQNVDGEFNSARYHVVYCFSASGFVDTNILKKVAQEFPEADVNELTFLNLDELKEFSLLVAQELEEDEVRLISVQDLNIGIDGSKDLSSFRQIFLGFGEVIRGEGAGNRKKNFLSRFF